MTQPLAEQSEPDRELDLDVELIGDLDLPDAAADAVAGGHTTDPSAPAQRL